MSCGRQVWRAGKRVKRANDYRHLVAIAVAVGIETLLVHLLGPSLPVACAQNFPTDPITLWRPKVCPIMDRA